MSIRALPSDDGADPARNPLDDTAVLDLLPVAVAVWDREARNVYANAAMQALYGEAVRLKPGLHLRDAVGAATFDAIAPYRHAVLAGVPQTFVTQVTRGDGVRDQRVQYLPWRGVTGQVDGYVVVAEDITAERGMREARAALEASERKFRALSEASPLGVYHTDAAGQCTYTNRRWHEIFGLTLADSLGDGWSRTLHPDDRDTVAAQWQRSAAAGEPFAMEYRVRRPDGTVRHVRSHARALADELGAVDGYVGTVEDVTDLREADARRRESEAFLDRTGRLARVGGWEVDLRTGQVRWSDETCRIHDRPPGHAVTLPEALAYYPEEARPVVSEAITAALERGQPIDIELPLITASGRFIWVRIVGEARSEAGRPVRLVGALQDVTARHEAEAHASELDALLTEREEMLQVLAHEVRQPLNNASAALQSATAMLAERGEQEATQRLARAQRVMGMVLSGVNNTLAASALLAGGSAPTLTDTDIDTLVAVTVRDLPAAESARIRIVRATTTRTATLDMGLMRLALRNVLANAIEHSPPGAVVELRISDSDEPLAILFDVADQGPGIDPGILPRLFERGVRGRPNGERAGHGLGLYIVRRVLELHGGRAEVLDTGPDGTVIRLTVTQGDLA